MIMKKLVFLMVAICLQQILRGQNQELVINYIAHDHYNEAILNAVDDIFNTDAFNNNRSTYLYLANAENPLILKCDRNHQKEFEDFRYAINSQLKHNVWPDVDIQRLLELLRQDDFLAESGEARYSFFTLNFYITPSFWSYNYNESLIARLFWDLELPSKTDFLVNIYHPENDGFQYDKDHMFGPKKLNGNYEVYLLTY